jgi:hypothetical protein
MRTAFLTALGLSALVAASPLSKRQTGTVSTDGSCGGANGNTCLNSIFGNCCSAYGWCGSDTGHCGSGCQTGFGTCTQATGGSTISPDGSCGGANKYTCQGSAFGDCCSAYGWSVLIQTEPTLANKVEGAAVTAATAALLMAARLLSVLALLQRLVWPPRTAPVVVLLDTPAQVLRSALAAQRMDGVAPPQRTAVPAASRASELAIKLQADL